MFENEPTRQQVLGTAFALVVLASFTAALVAVEFGWRLEGRLLVATLVGFLLFNFGIVFAIVKFGVRGVRTSGSKRASEAVLINLAAMLLRDFQMVWIALSACSAVLALIAAFSLFRFAEGLKT